MNLKSILFLFVVVCFLLFVFVFPLFATEPCTPKWKCRMQKLIKETPIVEEESLENKIFKIIQFILAFLGVIAVLMIIYGGFMWMTAGGSEEKITKAKKTLTYAVIGLIIILFAYAISVFVISRIQKF